MLHMQHEDCPSTFWGSRNAGADTTPDVVRAPESLENSLCYLVATVLRLLVANRRAMNSRSSGILHCLSSATALAGSDATHGSAAYQYINGRLWSLASSAWEQSCSRIGQRCSTGVRCKADARYSRTKGESSSRDSRRSSLKMSGTPW